MFQGHTVIDVHGHISSPPQVRAYAMNLIALRSPGDGELVLSDEAVGAARERHVRMLDERGIDVQLISPRPVAMLHWERPFITEHWTRVTNGLIAQMCRLEPDRFIGVGQLPQNAGVDTSNCIEELERCATELGFVGAILNPDPGGDNRAPGVHDPYWYPLYERAQDLGITLLVHPSISRDARLEPISHNYQLNNLFQETLATSLYEETDVFERFPRLRVVVSHCGGAPRRLLREGDALDMCADPHGLITDSGEAAGGSIGIARTAREPHVRRGLGNLFFDSCAYDPHFLSAALRQRGAERIVFGTESPGSGSNLINPATGRPADDLLATLNSFDFLTEKEKVGVVYDNALKAFPRLVAALG